MAIEDGVLLARVLGRQSTRSVAQMFHDYESLRRGDIRKLYRETMGRWNSSVTSGWIGGIVMEWMTWLVVKAMTMRPNYFARDVRQIPLPE